MIFGVATNEDRRQRSDKPIILRKSCGLGLYSFAKYKLLSFAGLLPWAWLSRRSGHPSARSVAFLKHTDFNAGQPGTASRRLPFVRLHLSCCHRQHHKFDSLGQCGSPCSPHLPRCRLRLRSARRSLSAFGSTLAAYAPPHSCRRQFVRRRPAKLTAPCSSLLAHFPYLFPQYISFIISSAYIFAVIFISFISANSSAPCI